MKMSLLFKKALTFIGGASLAVAIMAGVAGCSEEKPEVVPEDALTYYIYHDNVYIVVDGTLHYGGVSLSAKRVRYTHASWDIDVQDTPTLQLEDGTTVHTSQFKFFDEKPDSSWYDDECTDCLHK